MASATKKAGDNAQPASRFASRVQREGLRAHAFTPCDYRVTDITSWPGAPALPGFPPWLISSLSQMGERRRAGKLPHALLVHGAPGSGKRLLVEVLVAMFLCERIDETSAPDSLACGECGSCLQLASGNHPDFRLLQPESATDKPAERPSAEIKVDATREFVQWTQLTANDSRGRKVGVIDSFDSMNKASANAILKTLEEPARGTLIVAITDWPMSTYPTLTSRCQLVAINPLASDENEMLQWLGLAGVPDAKEALRRTAGAPLHALAEQQEQEKQAQFQRSFCDIVNARAGIGVWVERLAAEDPEDCLLAYLGFSAEMIRIKLGAEKYCTNQHLLSEWETAANCMSTAQWFALRDRLTALYRGHHSSIKVQPVLETIFAAIWQQRSE